MPDPSPEPAPSGKNLTNAFNGVIRPARGNELDKIMALERHCFTTEQWSDEDWQPYLEDSLVKDKKVFILLAFSTAAEAERPEAMAAGYGAAVFEDDRTAEIFSMGVHEAYRGRKLGRQLLDRVCESLRNAGAEKIVLEVRKENTAAIHLYETGGFVKTRDLPEEYPPDENTGASGDGIEMALRYPV